MHWIDALSAVSAPGPRFCVSYQVRHMIQMWLDNLRSGGSLKVTGYNDHGNVVLYILMLRRIQGKCLNYCHHPSLLLGICTYVDRSSNLVMLMILNLNHNHCSTKLGYNQLEKLEAAKAA